MGINSCLVFLILLLSLSLRPAVVFGDIQNPVVLFGCDVDYPPMSYLKNFKPAGFDIEIINNVAHKGNFNAEIKADKWLLVLEKLASGEIDAASGIIRTEERAALFDFSIPYLSESYAVFTQADSDLSSINKLKGRRLAVLENDAIIEIYITPNGLDDDIVYTSSFFRALQLVASGDADYTIAPYSMGLKAKDALGLDELKLSERPLMTVEYRFAVKKGRSELLFKLNDAVRTLYDTGIIDDLYKEAGFSRQFSLTSKDMYSPVFLVFILIGLVIIIIILMHFFVQRIIRIRVGQIESKKSIFELVLDNLPMMIFWKSSDLEIQGCNSRCRAAGGPSTDINISESTVLRSGKSSVEYVRSGPEGAQEWRRITCLPILDGNNEVGGVLGVSEDYSEHRRLTFLIEKLSAQLALKDAELEQHRLTDPSTGLFSPSYLRSKISEENALYSVHGQKFCIMLIGMHKDVAVNINTAGLIRKHLRHSDIAGRLNNGEFLVIMPKTGLVEAEKVSRKFSGNFSLDIEGSRLPCRVFELPSGEPENLPAEIRELLDLKREGSY